MNKIPIFNPDKDEFKVVEKGSFDGYSAYWDCGTRKSERKEGFEHSKLDTLIVVNFS